MKTCSDSLKALLHQYRTGEKRTWYIADLYTMWLNSSERIDDLINWSPFFDGHVKYAYPPYDKFSISLFDDARSEADRYKPLIRVGCPLSDWFDWNRDDWTIEFWVGFTSWLEDLQATNTHFYVGNDVLVTNAENITDGFAIGANGFAVNNIMWFWTRKNGERYRRALEFYGVPDIPDHKTVKYKHIAVSKQGRTLRGFCNGELKGEAYLDTNESLSIPNNSYMNISAGYGHACYDEIRVSRCVRYTANFPVQTAPFVTDINTLSLLHVNGNLDDEGYMNDQSAMPMKDFRSGEMYLYTGHDTDLTCGGNKYRHIAIEHGDIEESRGTETATMDLTINYNPSDTITPNDTRTWFKALKDGVFDKAYVSLDRLYSPIPWQYNMPNIPIDYVLKSRFFGRMEVQEVKLDHASIQIKSPTDMLTRELPRNLVKPSCLNHFGDFMCQINPEMYKVHTVAQAGSSRGSIVIPENYVEGYLNNGIIYSTSGANKGQYSAIKSFTNHRVILFKPFSEEVNAGDTFDISSGCDKTIKTCRDRYHNLVHFRGCPFLPCKNVLM